MARISQKGLHEPNAKAVPMWMQDLTSLGVTKTPTFFVNGRSLLNFGPEQLAALVAEEVAKVKK